MIDLDLKVDQVFQILEEAIEQEYIGEPVSQLEHALQCAQLAQAGDGSRALIIAALLHDIGHLCAPLDAAKMDEFGIDGHHRIAGDWLRNQGFGEMVATLVEGHVNAKRYLVSKHPKYLNELSLASQETLKRQGGPMTIEEMRAFETHPLFKEMLRLRAYDDRAKQMDWNGPSLNSYREIIKAHLLEIKELESFFELNKPTHTNQNKNLSS